MKATTTASKLAALFGIQQEVVETSTIHEEENKKNGKGKFRGIPEESIQNYREAQGLIYFLQAPKLFTARTCKHCGEGFLVSRHQVAYCSYNCIELELKKMGIDEWSRKNDIPSLVKEIYDDNEPLWVRNIDGIKSLINQVETLKTPSM